MKRYSQKINNTVMTNLTIFFLKENALACPFYMIKSINNIAKYWFLYAHSLFLLIHNLQFMHTIYIYKELSDE